MLEGSERMVERAGYQVGGVWVLHLDVCQRLVEHKVCRGVPRYCRVDSERAYVQAAYQQLH